MSETPGPERPDVEVVDVEHPGVASQQWRTRSTSRASRPIAITPATTRLIAGSSPRQQQPVRVTSAETAASAARWRWLRRGCSCGWPTSPAWQDAVCRDSHPWAVRGHGEIPPGN